MPFLRILSILPHGCDTKRNMSRAGDFPPFERVLANCAIIKGTEGAFGAKEWADLYASGYNCQAIMSKIRTSERFAAAQTFAGWPAIRSELLHGITLTC